MTSESISEQASAKLNECSNDEYKEFKKLNSEYKEKFNFPFIIAVKGKDKNEILNNFRQRIQSDVKSEFLEAKKQVKKIATFRLNEINKKILENEIVKPYFIQSIQDPNIELEYI